MSEPTLPPPPPSNSAATNHLPIGEWFNQAWASIKPAWLEYVLALLVFNILLVLVGFLSLCLIVPILLSGPILGGLYVYLGKRAIGVPAEISDIFKGFRKFADSALLFGVIFFIPAAFAILLALPAVLSSFLGSFIPQAVTEVLLSLSSAIGCLGCVGAPIFFLVYPIVVGTFFLFAFPLVMFKNYKAIDALKESAREVKTNYFGYLMLLLASVVILMAAQFLGALACGIGILVLSPLAYAIIYTMQIYAFMQRYGLSEADVEQYK